jgi:metal-responsive CopG/Arc/MetJ family transcriptional regulator
MVVKDGYRFIQGLLPARMHKDFTELSRRLGQSRSETLRNAIDAFLQNSSCKGGAGKNKGN